MITKSELVWFYIHLLSQIRPLCSDLHIARQRRVDRARTEHPGALPVEPMLSQDGSLSTSGPTSRSAISSFSPSLAKAARSAMRTKCEHAGVAGSSTK